MTTADDRDDMLSAEIEAVLLPAAPSGDDKAEWAREAMARAEDLPPAGRPRRARLVILGVAAAAAVLVLAVLAFGPRIGWYNSNPTPYIFVDPPAPEPAIERERHANEAVLYSPEVRARLAAAPEGWWALIAAGRMIAIESSLEAVQDALAGAELTSPPAHLFVFRVGTQGPVTYETTWPYELVAGNGFLAEADLGMAMGAEGTAFWTGERPPPPEEWTRFPTPDGRPFLPLEIRHPTASDEITARETFLVATGYGGPLILPEPTPTLLLLETPGLARVKDMHGEIRVFRRFTARVRCPEIGLDVMVEALGNLQTPPAPLEIGGLTWMRHRRSALETSRRSGKPIALLAADVSRGCPTAPFESDEIREKLEKYVRVVHMTPWTDPAGLSGPLLSCAPFKSPAELVVYGPRGGKDEGMTWDGRVPVTEDSAGRIRALLGHGLERSRGTRLVFRTGKPLGPAERKNLIAVLRTRFDGTGVEVDWLLGANPNPIRVDIPGRCRITEDEVIRRCTTIGKLEFRIVAETGDPTTDGPLDIDKERERREAEHLSYRPPICDDEDYPGYDWYACRDRDESDALVRLDRWNFGAPDLEKVRVKPDPFPEEPLTYIVSFGIVDTREKDFGEFTGPNSKDEGNPRMLAIILDGQVVVAPVLNSKLTDGGYIEGRYTPSEAESLAATLRSGQLPVPLEFVERR